jgi:hypothetical protein
LAVKTLVHRNKADMAGTGSGDVTGYIACGAFGCGADNHVISFSHARVSDPSLVKKLGLALFEMAVEKESTVRVRGARNLYEHREIGFAKGTDRDVFANTMLNCVVVQRAIPFVAGPHILEAKAGALDRQDGILAAAFREEVEAIYLLISAPAMDRWKLFRAQVGALDPRDPVSEESGVPIQHAAPMTHCAAAVVQACSARTV